MAASPSAETVTGALAGAPGLLGEREHPVSGRLSGTDIRRIQCRAVGAADHQDHRDPVTAGELAGQRVHFG